MNRKTDATRMTALSVYGNLSGKSVAYKRGVYKKKSTDKKVDALRPGYDLDGLLKKDARGKYAK